MTKESTPLYLAEQVLAIGLNCIEPNARVLADPECSNVVKKAFKIRDREPFTRCHAHEVDVSTPTQEDNTMPQNHCPDPDMHAIEAKAREMHAAGFGMTQPDQPSSPTERFASAANSVDAALQELSHIVSVLTGQDEGKDPEVAGRSTPSVMQIVRQYPDELEVVAKRIHTEIARLRDAFFTP